MTAVAGTSVAAALRLAGVSVDVGGARILDGVDLEVGRGQIVAVTGPNGAGKTTLLDVVTRDVAAIGTIERPERGRIARLFQGSPLPDTLTVAEILELAAGRDWTEVAARFGLADHLDKRVSELSTGMRRIVDLAATTARPHDLLLLDEPAAGLADVEITHLAQLIRQHVKRAGVSALVVEHNRALIDAIADTVVELEGGRVRRRRRRHRHAPPIDPIVVRDALTALASSGVHPAPPARHEISTWTKLRLGLREFAAGMASVLILGVLNRVMKVELGIGLAVVAVLLASYNLAAPVAAAIGHRSDQRPIFGRHRAPYIVGGAVLSGTVLAAAPHLADRLANGIDPFSLVVALGAFVVMGVGMYGSGTVYFALIADVTPRHERGHAASIVYLMLMGGIVAGAALSATVLGDDASGRHNLFAIVGALVIALTSASVWGLDPGVVDEDDLPEPTSAWQAVRGVAAIAAARRFFVFTLLASVFLFLQQAVLEPYGGEVLGLSVRATTGFNAVQTLGVLVGMVVTGRSVADRAGNKRTARVGLIGSSVAFAALSVAAVVGSAPASWFAILGAGVATGLFSVAVLALMMDMAVPERVALFMGAWTVSHALADGVATAGGGVIHELTAGLAGGVGVAYAVVFGVQAIGLLACAPLLARIDVATFATEVAAETARRDAAAMGWILPDVTPGGAPRSR